MHSAALVALEPFVACPVVVARTYTTDTEVYERRQTTMGSDKGLSDLVKVISGSGILLPWLGG